MTDVLYVQVQASEKEAKSEYVRHMAELSHEKAQLEKLRETNTLLSTELKEKVYEIIAIVLRCDRYTHLRIIIMTCVLIHERA